MKLIVKEKTYSATGVWFLLKNGVREWERTALKLIKIICITQNNLGDKKGEEN